MQKTLFTLALAASSIALADTTLDDAVLQLAPSEVTESTSLSGLGSGIFSFTITLNQNFTDFMGSYVGSPLTSPFLAGVQSASNHLAGAAVGYSSTTVGGSTVVRDGGIFIATTLSDEGEAGGFTAGGQNIAESTDWGTVTNMALTLTFANNTTADTATGNGMTYLTLTFEDGTTKTYTGSSNNSLRWSSGFGDWSTFQANTEYVSSAYVFDSVVTEADAYALNTAAIAAATPAVPEPATATLSLLALAGLAARRRRALRAS